MAEYIDRDELAKWLKDESDSYGMKDIAPVGWTLIGLINELSKIPTADVVERKRGKWELFNNSGLGFSHSCSLCNFEVREQWIDFYNFCPNCGADMREESW